MKKVKFVKNNINAITPKRSDNGSAGYDLYACLDNTVWISPHETVFIDTGIAVALPKNTFGGIFARSGLSCKNGLAPANKVGVIDSSYRGNIKVALHNHSNKSYEVHPGERIAQMVVMPYIPIEFKEVDELSNTERGIGGFGSTGK